MSQEPKPKQPWFGPKRIGYGINPKTWQGWLIILIIVIIIVLVARVLVR